MLKSTGKSLVVLALILFFLFLVLSRTPAAWGAWAIHKAVPNFWLTGVSGTLWQGRANHGQVDIDTSTIALGDVNWQLNPWTLLLLKPCLTFETSLPGQRATGEICHQLGGNSHIRDVTIDAPAGVLNGVLPVEISGQAQLQALKGEFAKQQIKKLDASLSWQGGRVNTGESWLSLGSYAAKFKASAQGGIEADIFDLDAIFKVKFAASWQAQDGWRTEGTIAPKPSAPENATTVLSVVGEEIEAGVYRVVWP